MKKLLTVMVCAIVFCASGALAHSYKQGDIEIGHIWARETTPNMTSAVIYAPLLNTGADVDKLIGLSTEIAAKAELHQTTNISGVIKMQKVDAVKLEPNKPVSLRPRGLHIMLIGLKQQLKDGEKFPLTMQFEKAGSIIVDVMVEKTDGKQEHNH